MPSNVTDALSHWCRSPASAIICANRAGSHASTNVKNDFSQTVRNATNSASSRPAADIGDSREDISDCLRAERLFNVKADVCFTDFLLPQLRSIGGYHDSKDMVPARFPGD